MTTLAILAAAALAAAPAAPKLLTLDDAVALARARHPDLRAARAEVTAAEARSDETRAALLPQVGASASYARQGSGTGADAVRRNAWSAGGSVDQLVWDFGRSVGALRAAQASATATGAGAHETERTVVRAARRAYAEAQARRRLVDVARENAAFAQAQLEKVQALVEVGSKPRSDLAAARSDAALARVDEVQARWAYDVARAALAQAIGAEGGAFEVGDDAMPALPGEDGTAAALLGGALADRPAVAQLAAELRAQDATVASARAAFLPALSVGASGAEAGARADALEPTWSAGATLTWSLYDGGATAARVREARATRVGLAAQEDALRQQLRLELEEALAAVQGAKASLEAADAALASAREQVALAEARYQTGSGTLLELSQARATRATAAGKVVQAQWDLSAARADLALALGDG